VKIVFAVPETLGASVPLPAYLEDYTQVVIQAGDIRDLMETLEDMNATALLAAISETGLISIEPAEEGGYRVSSGRSTVVLPDLPTGIAVWASSDETAFDS